MTALSQVIVIISNELNVTYAQAIRLERKLQAAGYCIAQQKWVEQAACIMDEWQAVRHERRNHTGNAGRGAIAPRPTGGSHRQLSEGLRVRRDGDGDSAAVGEVVTDLRLGTDGGAP